MEEYSLPRTGQSNIVFTGDQLASAKSPAYRRHTERPQVRAHWFESAVYRTKGGKFIATVAYRWSGKLYRESNQDYVTVCNTEAEAMQYLESFDPTTCVNGYPEGEFWVTKQADLMVSLREDFDLLVEVIETQVKQAAEPERVE